MNSHGPGQIEYFLSLPQSECKTASSVCHKSKGLSWKSSWIKVILLFGEHPYFPISAHSIPGQPGGIRDPSFPGRKTVKKDVCSKDEGNLGWGWGDKVTPLCPEFRTSGSDFPLGGRSPSIVPGGDRGSGRHHPAWDCGHSLFSVLQAQVTVNGLLVEPWANALHVSTHLACLPQAALPRARGPCRPPAGDKEHSFCLPHHAFHQRL